MGKEPDWKDPLTMLENNLQNKRDLLATKRRNVEEAQRGIAETLSEIEKYEAAIAAIKAARQQ